MMFTDINNVKITVNKFDEYKHLKIIIMDHQNVIKWVIFWIANYCICNNDFNYILISTIQSIINTWLWIKINH